MRLHFATALALLPLALAAPAQAQSRYGPASPIPPVAAAPIYGEALTWSGKVAVQGQQTPQGALPQPLSPWAQRQAAQSTAGPAVATLPPSPSTPRPIAGSPTLRGSTSPEAAPAPAPAPQGRPPPTQAAPSPQASSLAPAAAPPSQAQSPAPVQQAAAPAPAARNYPGYGVPQRPNYPGYQAPASAARTAALPPPAPAAAPSSTGGHAYSVGREYGMQPDLIGPHAPQGGAELTLTEVPSTPSLAGYDESDDPPRRRQGEETNRP
jgi:hypothetical protein